MTVSTEENPAQLFPEGILSEPVTHTKWFVAHTKSRREKALAHFLANRQIGYCLPLMQVRQKSARRERHSLLPLFGGYLFFKGTVEDRHSAFSSNHVARVIDVEDQERLRDELAGVLRVLATNVPLIPCAFLRQGQRVRIKSGPLQDIEGIIDRKKDELSLVLSVTTISQSIAVHVDASLVEAV
jgi:transcription antitermination factor NusG